MTSVIIDNHTFILPNSYALKNFISTVLMSHEHDAASSAHPYPHGFTIFFYTCHIASCD